MTPSPSLKVVPGANESAAALHENERDFDGIENGRPDTHHYLSWGAIKFIEAPSSRFLSFSLLSLVGAAFVIAALLSFVRIDIAVEAPGEVDGSLGVREAVTKTDGILSSINVRTGESVKQDQVLATLKSPSKTSLKCSKKSGLASRAGKTNAPRCLPLPKAA